MKLSILLIYENLRANYPGLEFYGESGELLCGVRAVGKNKKISIQDYLYVVIDETVNLKNNVAFGEEVRLQEFSFILRKEKYCSQIQQAILVPPQYSMEEIFNEAVAVFGTFQEWEASVLDAIARNQPLTDILNLSGIVTRDTVYLADTSLKMTAHSTPTLMEDVSAIWRYQVKYGYMPMNVIRKLIDTGELDVMNSERDAFTYPTEGLNLPYTCKNIFRKNVLQAHVFIVSIYSKPTQTHHEIAEALGRMLSIYLENNPDNISLFGTFHESFLRDVLEQRLHNADLIKTQLSYFNWKIDDAFALMVLTGHEDSPYEKQKIVNHLTQEKKIDCSVFEFGEYLLVLHHNPDRDFIREDAKIFLTKHSFYGAFSKVFCNLTDMHIYYEQAKKTLIIGQKLSPETHVFFNNDYGIYNLIANVMEGHSVFEVCHEGLLQLYETDQEKGTDYVNTLYQYISNDRNVLKTSKVLFVHRNTLLHRLDKISEVLKLENESPETWHYILISIYILKYCVERG